MIAQQPGVTPAQRSTPRRGPLVAFFLLLACLVVAGMIGGLLPRLSRQKGLLAASQAVAERRPVVLVSPAHLSTSKDTIDLPGDLTAMIESPIFSRADGYLKTRLVDIGWHLKTGQLMAEIETPELDQQITQARASLAQAQSSLKELEADIQLSKANLDLARVTWERWKSLLARGVVSRQDADSKQADFAVKEATTQRAEASLATAHDMIHASQASLGRLEELKSFARVTAPFDGVVTARDVDIGTLITAGNKELFRVAKIDPLRIFVNVPQTYVQEMQNGQIAELRVQERPGQVFQARVTNIANSLDTNSRSMLVILETPNPGATLYPGMYAQVRFSAVHPKPTLRIPGDAIIFGTKGASVATVGADRIVHFKSVTIGQDLGSEVEVTSGLSPGDLVISNPSDSVQENAVVEVRDRSQ
ncbi:Efflux transporter, RND family, MFP subunit [Candidatus Sulfopaludibacter sp. SbA4]|nr:Efflux transporter, RND family, MFP subunit [Candidatus Sulfopaludibacter sp. SbA4]